MAPGPQLPGHSRRAGVRRVDRARRVIIVEELNVLEDESKVRAVEAAVLAWARKHPLQRIRQIARREVARADATAAERHYRRVKRDRRIVLQPGEHGTAHLVLSHDGVLSAQVMNSLTKAALKLRRAGDERTTDQLRADIAIQRLLGLATTRTGNARADRGRTDGGRTDGGRTDGGRTDGGRADGGRADSAHTEERAAGEYRADDGGRGQADTDGAGTSDARIGDARTGEADSGGTDDGNSDGSGDGSGRGGGTDAVGDAGSGAGVVIHATAEELRALLEYRCGTGGEVSAPTWLGPLPQAALRDALSRALEAAETGRTAPGPLRVHLTDQPPASDPDRYVPSRRLDQWIRDRDRRCRFPGCNRPAMYTDGDHRVAFADGGRTTADNLHCLCRHHHRLKHRGGWTLQHDPDTGATTWISPTGRTYQVDDNDP